MHILHVNFVPNSLFGVKKKIDAQIDSLRELGHKVDICTYTKSGYMCLGSNIYVNNTSKLNRKFNEYKLFHEVENLVSDKSFDVVYVRFMRMTPWYFRFLKSLSKICDKLVIEVATYPYDSEYSKFTPLSFIDKFYRVKLKKFVDAISYYGEKIDHIWGIPAIHLENAVNVKNTPQVSKPFNNNELLKVIAVANLSTWHAYDRFIRSIGKQKDLIENRIKFLIVGDGPEKGALSSLVNKLNLEELVEFKGPLQGAELDDLFNSIDIGVCSLGLHRIGHESLTPLKPAEYCARGIPFILSNVDSRFDNQSFLYRVESNETLIDILDVIDWYKKGNFCSEDIRYYALNNLTWDKQMNNFVKELDRI